MPRPTVNNTGGPSHSMRLVTSRGVPHAIVAGYTHEIGRDYDTAVIGATNL
jgi:hypothetical protein